MKDLVRHAMLITPVLMAITAAILIAYAGSAGSVGNQVAAPQGATMSIPF